MFVRVGVRTDVGQEARVPIGVGVLVGVAARGCGSAARGVGGVNVGVLAGGAVRVGVGVPASDAVGVGAGVVQATPNEVTTATLLGK